MTDREFLTLLALIMLAVVVLWCAIDWISDRIKRAADEDADVETGSYYDPFAHLRHGNAGPFTDRDLQVIEELQRRLSIMRKHFGMRTETREAGKTVHDALDAATVVLTDAKLLPRDAADLYLSRAAEPKYTGENLPDGVYLDSQTGMITGDPESGQKTATVKLRPVGGDS